MTRRALLAVALALISSSVVPAEPPAQVLDHSPPLAALPEGWTSDSYTHTYTHSPSGAVVRFRIAPRDTFFDDLCVPEPEETLSAGVLGGILYCKLTAADAHQLELDLLLKRCPTCDPTDARHYLPVEGSGEILIYFATPQVVVSFASYPTSSEQHQEVEDLLLREPRFRPNLFLSPDERDGSPNPSLQRTTPGRSPGCCR